MTSVSSTGRILSILKDSCGYGNILKSKLYYCMHDENSGVRGIFLERSRYREVLFVRECSICFYRDINRIDLNHSRRIVNRNQTEPSELFVGAPEEIAKAILASLAGCEGIRQRLKLSGVDEILKEIDTIDLDYISGYNFIDVIACLVIRKKVQRARDLLEIYNAKIASSGSNINRGSATGFLDELEELTCLFIGSDQQVIEIVTRRSKKNMDALGYKVAAPPVSSGGPHL